LDSTVYYFGITPLTDTTRSGCHISATEEYV